MINLPIMGREFTFPPNPLMRPTIPSIKIPRPKALRIRRRTLLFQQLLFRTLCNPFNTSIFLMACFDYFFGSPALRPPAFSGSGAVYLAMPPQIARLSVRLCLVSKRKRYKYRCHYLCHRQLKSSPHIPTCHSCRRTKAPVADSGVFCHGHEAMFPFVSSPVRRQHNAP
jgi:hypothetical protein